MIVAMVPVDVVQVTVHQIVNVVAVGDRLVPASRPMNMIRLMTATPMLRRAHVGVGFRNGDHVLIDVTIVRVMQVPIM